jgi:DNA-binding MarR family transcriptional regulator
LQAGAVFPLLVALWYALLGIWRRGMRMALLGLVLGLLTVAGYFWLAQYFLLWMAVVGGGALILGGFWLRRGLTMDPKSDQPDPVIHQPVRLKIMAALKPLPARELLEFTRLKTIIGATDGNLGAHIANLEEFGDVEVQKDFFLKKPRTRVRLTKTGRRPFEDYIAYLREIGGQE